MITQEQIEIIERVAKRVHHKYVFGYHTSEDIIQQAIAFGIEAIKDWDQTRPLENFLSIVIPNKLKNFKRNTYYRLDISENNQKRYESNSTKKKLMETTELFDFDLSTECNVLEKLSYEEIVRKLLKDMPPHIRSDFKRLLNDVKIPKVRKEQVYNYIKEILNEDW